MTRPKTSKRLSRLVGPALIVLAAVALALWFRGPLLEWFEGPHEKPPAAMGGHDHGGMGGMPGMGAMDHADHAGMDHADHGAMDHGAMDHGAMDHGDHEDHAVTDHADHADHAAMDHAAASPGPAESPLYYTCPMHPSVREPKPGKCPICGMTLTPVGGQAPHEGEHAATNAGTVTLGPTRTQLGGVRFSEAVRAPMRRTIRTLGVLQYDEAKLRDVTLRVDGWIERLYADETGAPIARGDKLFDLYSPQLLAAEQELLAAAHREQRFHDDGTASAVDSVRKRLRLLGLTSAQVRAVIHRGSAREVETIRAPSSGFVVEKQVVDGAFVKAGAQLYRIAPLDPIWVQAEVFERDLPFVAVGQRVELTFPGGEMKPASGTIEHVYPDLDPRTRTAKVRIALPNPDHALKTEMFVNASLEVDLGEQLQVPVAAVIYTGTRRIVFVHRGEGRLEPTEITVGPRNDAQVAVRAGLEPGERVVASGTFLVAAESRLRSATTYWASGHDDH